MAKRVDGNGETSGCSDVHRVENLPQQPAAAVPRQDPPSRCHPPERPEQEQEERAVPQPQGQRAALVTFTP